MTATTSSHSYVPIALALCALLVLAGCASPGAGPGEGFAISLADSGEVILSDEDITSYDAATHTMTLTPEAVERLRGYVGDWEGAIPGSGLQGREFVATLDGEELYRGALWSAIFSRSYDGIIIVDVPLTFEQRTLQVRAGYPGPEAFTGEDPRADPALLAHFRQRGELVE